MVKRNIKIQETDDNPSPNAIKMREWRHKKKLEAQEEAKQLLLAQAKEEKNWAKLKQAENYEETQGRPVLNDEDFHNMCRSGETLNSYIKDKPHIIDYPQTINKDDGAGVTHADFWHDSTDPQDNTDPNNPNYNRPKKTVQDLFKELNGDRCE